MKRFLILFCGIKYKIKKERIIRRSYLIRCVVFGSAILRSILCISLEIYIYFRAVQKYLHLISFTYFNIFNSLNIDGNWGHWRIQLYNLRRVSKNQIFEWSSMSDKWADFHTNPLISFYINFQRRLQRNSISEHLEYY